MIDNDENKYYVGKLVKGSKILGFLATYRKTTQLIITLLVLTALLEITGSFFAAKNFFSQETGTMNPIKLFINLSTHPILGFVVVLGSLILGSVITKILLNKSPHRYVENIRGDKVDQTGIYGRSKIADEDEISQVFELTSEHDTRGCIVGEQLETGKIICKNWERTDFVQQLTNNHILLAGPSGVGKTTSFILPNILSHIQAGNSLIIFDPKGEIYSEVTPIALSQGYENIRVLNVRTEELDNSDGWDILKPIREAFNPETTANSFTDCILRNLGSNKTDFWNNSNKNLLQLVLLYVSVANNFVPIKSKIKKDREGNIMKPGPKERVFREVAAYIESPEILKANVASAIAADPTGDGRLLSGRYTTWTGNKEWLQIASGLSTALTVFRTIKVSEILSEDDINIKDLAEKKSMIFVIPPVMDDAFQPITSLFFMSAMNELVSYATKKQKNTLDRMVYLVLEEFASIGEIPTLREALNTVRSYNIAMMICVQQVADIKGMYADQIKNKEAFKSIFENCVLQICMGANFDDLSKDFSNATYFSAKSGTQTIYDTISTEHRSKLLPEKFQEITVLDKRQMGKSTAAPVYLPDDIARLKGDEMLVFPAMHNVFKCNKFFWRRHPLSQIALRNRKTHNPFILKTCNHTPHYLSGTNELYDITKYELYDGRYERTRRVSSEESSGVSYSSLM